MRPVKLALDHQDILRVGIQLQIVHKKDLGGRAV